MTHLQTIVLSALAFAVLTLANISASYKDSKGNTALDKFRDYGRQSPATEAHGPSERNTVEPEEELDLLDTVLLASVDGRFHALNRTSGRTIWSMDDPLILPVAQSNFYPLVRTQHPLPKSTELDFTPLLDDTDRDVPETYIIEPQTGAIFVNPPSAKRDDPLQRLPFGIPELVEMSPFKYDDVRTFVGKKTTSFITLDLRTGEVLEIMDPDRCDVNEAPPTTLADDELLDGLEDESAPRKEKLEVHIGRTDYHVSVFSRGRAIQNLTFTAYGPNNVDKAKQELWRRTPDNQYFQSMPDGTLVLLKAEERQPIQSYLTFHRPIVAVFDVLLTPSRGSPFLLLQPTPKLPDLYSPSSLDPERLSQLVDLTRQELTFVGKIGNSLYAMSQLHFPLVSFSEVFPNRRTIDSTAAPEGSEAYAYQDQEDYSVVCRSLDCLTGVHFSESARSTRMSRLITDGAGKPPSHYSPSPVLNSPSSTPLLLGDKPSKSTTSIIPAPSHHNPANAPLSSPIDPVGNVSTRPGLDQPPSIWTGGNSVLAALTSVLAVVLWLLFKKVRHTEWTSTLRPPPAPVQMFDALNGTLSNGQQHINLTPIEKELPPIPQEYPSYTATPPDQNGILSAPQASLSAPELIPNHIPSASLPSLSPSTSTLQLPLPPPTPQPPTTSPEMALVDDEADGDGGDSDREGNGANGGTALKKRRRKRGRGGKKAVVIDPAAIAAETVKDTADKDSEWQAVDVDSGTGGSTGSNVVLVPSKPAQPAFASSLTVSDTVLGYGSHGTVVYQGSFQGRAVAVKRLLNDFVTLATREVTLLQESDDHPNVIRYYFKESKDNFLYIALELCPASLADLIERPAADGVRDLVAAFEPKRALAQITAGLRHLHGMKIVHRDIKPQNILISRPNTVRRTGGSYGGKAPSYRMLISDFGLCRKLDSDQTSFLPTHVGAAGAGTVGWRAPEILRGEVNLAEQTGGEGSTGGGAAGGTPNSSVGGTGSAYGGSRVGVTRLTKAVDIFALGCLFYYTLTGGEHPYGDRYERESNILKNQMNLTWLERLGEEGSEAEDLIRKMLDMDPKRRPDTTDILLHSFFWTPARRLAFLQDASDRFEIMERDPREAPLIALEAQANAIVGPDWHKRLDKLFIDNLGKFRKYDGKSVQDLLRALRNKKHHYQDLPENVKRSLGPLPHGFLAYFTRRFPRLFLHVYYTIADDPLLRGEAMFRSYFELADLE